MKPEDSKLQQLLREKYLQSGKAQKDVYLSAGVKPSTFSEIINLNKVPNVELFGKICKALGYDLVSFLSGEIPTESANPADFMNFPLLGLVRAGYSNGHLDVQITDADVEQWDGPVISVARDFLKKGLRGDSLRDIIAMKITGDSMAPIFQEGDHVFVKKMQDINRVHHKDIIVFDTDGCGSYTLKMWDKAGVLVPLNPKHDVITLAQCPGSRLYGRAIGLERTF